MIFGWKMVSIMSICLFGLAMLECKNKDDSEDETPAVLLLAAAALTQRPAYSFSCNRGGFCENIYGTVSGMSQTDCVNASGTVQTSRCTASNTVGMCTYNVGTRQYLEKVYYSGTFTAGTAASNCTVLLGTFASTYTQ